mgnify:CR=1 FL=1
MIRAGLLDSNMATAETREMKLISEVNSIDENLMTHTLEMANERHLDSLWIDTPRGLLHIFINGDGSWKMTAWNSKGDTITKNKKRGHTYYHLKQVLND